MKPCIKIDFNDFWPDFNKYDNYFYNFLSKHYEVIITKKPDFLFYSTFGNEHHKHRCIKIYYTGESVPPNYHHCDFSLSFERRDDIRNLRFPLYNLYGDMSSLLKPKKPYSEVAGKHAKFCNMVVSNPNCQKRIDFFHKLSNYKQVDSGGKYLNNVGGPVGNKGEFIEKYKFTLAFENNSYPGYTTEKIVEPIFRGSMPVYWGNPYVSEDFNTKSFINWHDFGSDEAVIERIIELDNDDAKYQEVYVEPFFNGNKLSTFCDESRLMRFLDSIFLKRQPRDFFRYRREAIVNYYKLRCSCGIFKANLFSLLKRGSIK
jgi:hypothetical protein